MKRSLIRLLALFLVIVTIVMALPITASAASSSSRCKHRRTKTTTYETAYEASTSTKHIRIRYRKEVCKSCDKILDTWTEEKERNHDFDDGVCEDCEYQRSVADLLEEGEIIVWKNGSKTVYRGIEKTTWDYAPKNISGTTMVPLTIATEVLGGEYLYWDSSTNSAYIELDNEEVCYQKNNKKYWLNGKKKTANQKAQIIDGKLYVELKSLTKLTHQDVDYKDGYVFISDDGLTSKEMKQIIDYLYSDKSNKDNLVNDIKAGKVYATSSDGKHIYKRTYDASKSLKYTDVYLCTIFNIELPKSAVMILNGNYLYVDGQKSFADVDTLQTADKRISQLNRIIDGANNAYSNKVISKTRRNSIRNTANASIAEYEDVAKGIKALSKVSEVKKSYTAKVGSKNNIVKTIQQKLLSLGFTSQHTEGNYDEVTFNNIAYLQIVEGLTVTGWVDEATYKVLMNSKTDISEEIKTIQKQPNTLPLSKTDIEKGVKVVTVGANQYYDCTEVLNEVFVNAANEAKKHQLLNPNLLLRGSAIATSTDGVNLLWFASKVCDKADWDIKIEASWKRTVGTTFPGRNAPVMFYGKLYTISELGNMLYGYTGTAMKIPEEILYICGGLVATKSLEFIFLEDYGDGEDRPLIKEGIEWYKKQH